MIPKETSILKDMCKNESTLESRKLFKFTKLRVVMEDSFQTFSENAEKKGYENRKRADGYRGFRQDVHLSITSINQEGGTRKKKMKYIIVN